MGSVKSMRIGLIAATTAKVLMRALTGGSGGTSRPRFLARRRLRIGWKVSPMKQPSVMVKAAKKSIVHSVQRQPLSTDTKEPITGL